MRDGRWMSSAAQLPVGAGGPKSVPTTTVGVSWPGRGPAAQYSATPAGGGVLQRSCAPSVTVYGNAMTAASPAGAASAAAAAAAAHTKPSTTGSASTKCPFTSSAVMPNSLQHPATAAAGFNTQIKYATTHTRFVLLCRCGRPNSRVTGFARPSVCPSVRLYVCSLIYGRAPNSTTERLRKTKISVNVFQGCNQCDDFQLKTSTVQS